MPTIERDQSGNAVALSWAKGEGFGPSASADNVAAESCACEGPSCAKAVPPQRSRRGPSKRFCSDACRRAAWELEHPRLGTQKALDFTPPVLRVAQPPHNPALVHRLKPAALKVLALLEDGRPHDRQELQAVGGNRYAARVEEIRSSGRVVLGPRKSPKHRIFRTEPMGPGQVERYRLPFPENPSIHAAVDVSVAVNAAVST